MKKSMGSDSVTPSRADVSLTAFSAIRSSLSANAVDPSYQCTVTRSPLTVRHAFDVSW